MSHIGLVQLKAAGALVGRRVRFCHTPDVEENYYQVVCAFGGMVELEGWSGEFAPELFVVHE